MLLRGWYYKEMEPPVKPGKNADRKTLLAYHAELRRYHRMLEALEQRLRQQTSAAVTERLKQIINSAGEPGAVKPKPRAAVTLPEPECGCGVGAACQGCDCPECIQWRKTYKITDEMVVEWDFQELIEHAKRIHTADTTPAPATDEATKFFAQYEKQMSNYEPGKDH